MTVQKVIVFDLDETLGFFTEFGVFFDALQKMYRYKNIMKHSSPPKQLFSQVFDIYSDFYLRPSILSILRYIREKKKEGVCSKVILYTNNCGGRKWVKRIISFIEKKLKYKLFDKLIYGFYLFDTTKRIDKCRTSQEKTYKDLRKCGKIPKSAKICFLMIGTIIIKCNIQILNM